VSHELVGNVDLAPSILEAAAARPGKRLDGRSLLPFARNPRRRSRRALLHETGGRRYVSIRDHDAGEAGAVRRVMTYRAVRIPRWLYVEYRAGARELYDLKRDPNELRSLDAEPAESPVRTALHRELDRLASCSGAACRSPLPELPEPPPVTSPGGGYEVSVALH
jgi:N-acetylglucosamine-6-sulfatase